MTLRGAPMSGGIADFGDMLIAWFRDPDGQVLSVVQST